MQSSTWVQLQSCCLFAASRVVSKKNAQLPLDEDLEHFSFENCYNFAFEMYPLLNLTVRCEILTALNKNCTFNLINQHNLKVYGASYSSNLNARETKFAQNIDRNMKLAIIILQNGEKLNFVTENFKYPEKM